MQSLQDYQGYPTVNRALRYLSIRLGSREETANLGQEIDDERLRLNTAYESWLQSLEERVAATAVIRYLDSLVDDEVMTIAREVAVITGNDTTSEFYMLLFPVAPSSAIAGVANDTQNQFVAALIDRIENDDRYEALQDRVLTLKEAQANLERAVAERKRRRIPERRTASDLQVALASARRAYNMMFPRLSLLFENKSYVETFFATIRKPRKNVQDAPPQTTLMEVSA